MPTHAPLLSDLELAVFLTLDWSPKVIDIREQFPLRVEDTVRLAETYGLPHSKFQGIPQVLSSDFLVDFDDPTRPAMALQAKYSTDLEKPEVIERLELERRYWEEKEISGPLSPRGRSPGRHLPTSSGSTPPRPRKILSSATSNATTACSCTSSNAILSRR